MYYYLPNNLVNRTMYVGDSLNLLNACFTGLDTGLYNLSVFTLNRTNFLSTTMISVSSRLQTQINNLQVSSISIPNNIVPFFGFTFRNTSYTNFDIALSAKGSGSILAQVPDNTPVGGNKRGRNSVDWQKSRSDASQVVSGNFSVLGGGDSNTVNGNYSFIGGGQQNIVLGDYSGITGGRGNSALSAYSTIAGGQNNAAAQFSFVGGGLNNSALASASVIPGGNGAVTYHVGQFSHANGFFASAGDAQFSRFILRGTTNSSNRSTLLKPSGNTNFTMPNNRVWDMNIKVTAVDINGTTNSYNANFVTRNLSNTLSSISGQGVRTDANTNLNLTVSSNNVVCFSALSLDSATWYWTAVVDTVDVAIPL